MHTLLLFITFSIIHLSLSLTTEDIQEDISHVNLVTKGIKTLIKDLMRDDDNITLNDLYERIITLHPPFRNDPLFNILMPILYDIEVVEIGLSKEQQNMYTN